MLYPSLVSDWNHRNAHFLRGVATELLARGHRVTVWEPRDNPIVRSLVEDQSEHALRGFLNAYPLLTSHRYDLASLDLDAMLDGADLVMVHEWSDPELVRRVGEHRRSGRYRLLFHDTHHLAVSRPDLDRAGLEDYDGVLAIGDAIREAWERRGWGRRAWTWHEAADTRVFHPIEWYPPVGDLVWVGNWAGDAGLEQLEAFLLEPVRTLRLKARVHGVNYAQEARDLLASSHVEYGGWLPNYAVPELFARYRATVQFPRGPYIGSLPGVPSIRVFEALACAIPLIDACEDDIDGLFTPGEDYLVARDGAEMKRQLRALLNDRYMAEEIAEHGWMTVLSRHTCAHRVDELLAIAGSLGVDVREPTELREGRSESWA